MSEEAGSDGGNEHEKLTKMVDDKLKVLSGLMEKPWQILWIKRKDPERYKAFSRIERRLLELRLRLESGPLLGSPMQTLKAAVSQVSCKLSREGAWDLAENLKWLLLCVADDEHLAVLVQAERYAPAEGRLSWAKEFGDDRDGFGPLPTDEPRLPAWRSMAIARLSALYGARMDVARHERAALQLRANYLLAVTCVLGVFLGLSGLCNIFSGLQLGLEPDRGLLTAIAAGALGSVLSGTYKLRDQMMGIRQLRSFWSALLAQPFVGATAAMLVVLIIKSGIVKFGDFDGATIDWRQQAIIGFISGFSEPFFLGIVGHLSSLKENPAQATTRTKEDMVTPPATPTDAARPLGGGPGK